MLKRILDIVFALVLLVPTLPFMLVAAVGIKLSSPGPIFYRAARAGKDGQPFAMMKFRSMHLHDDFASKITAPGDTRIFPFGKFIRATKIDEMPQVFNILKGDMSVVGPRPEDPGIVEKYYEDWMMKTLSVRPGLTSPGSLYAMQVFDNTVSADDPEASYVARVLAPRLQRDLNHMRDGSVIGDLKIVFQTGLIVLRRLLTRGVRE